MALVLHWRDSLYLFINAFCDKEMFYHPVFDILVALMIDHTNGSVDRFNERTFEVINKITSKNM